MKPLTFFNGSDISGLTKCFFIILNMSIYICHKHQSIVKIGHFHRNQLTFIFRIIFHKTKLSCLFGLFKCLVQFYHTRLSFQCKVNVSSNYLNLLLIIQAKSQVICVQNVNWHNLFVVHYPL